jgi:hypothetical protein
MLTGPRLLKLAIFPVDALNAPTLYDSSIMAGGSLTVKHEDPEFPAEATVRIPAAR